MKHDCYLSLHIIYPLYTHSKHEPFLVLTIPQKDKCYEVMNKSGHYVNYYVKAANTYLCLLHVTTIFQEFVNISLRVL